MDQSDVITFGTSDKQNHLAEYKLQKPHYPLSLLGFRSHCMTSHLQMEVAWSRQYT